MKKNTNRTQSKANNTNEDARIVKHMTIFNEDNNQFKYDIYVNRKWVTNIQDLWAIAQPVVDYSVPLIAHVEFEDIDRMILSQDITNLGNGHFDVKEKTYWYGHFTIDLIMAPVNVELYTACMETNMRPMMAGLLAGISDRMREDAKAKGLDDRPSVVLDYTYDQIIDPNSNFTVNTQNRYSK